MPRIRSLLPSLTMLVSTFAVTWLTLGLVERANGLLYLWPLTGLQLGLLLPMWQTGWSALLPPLASGAIGIMLGATAAGMPGGAAVMVGLISACDVTLAAWIMSPGILRFDDLKERSKVLRFGIASLVAPLIMGTAAALATIPVTHEPFGRIVTATVLADSLGIAIVLPAILFLTSGEYRDPGKLRPFLLRGTIAGVVFVAMACYAFWQNRNPILYAVFPPMVMMVLAMGLEGATFTGVALTVIGCTATHLHHGPIWLAVGASNEHRMVMMQTFLWVGAATALPVGALLDERRRAERSTNEARSIYQTLLQNAEDMIILSSMDGNRRYISPAVKSLTGWTPEEFMALDRLQTFHPDDRDLAGLVMESMASGKQEHVFRYRMAQKSGGYRWVEAVARAYFDEKTGQVRGYVGTIRDISSLKQYEETWEQERETLTREKQAMAKLAHTDALTVLPNRRAFDDALYMELNRSVAMTVMMIDVDFFKAYNDSYGHQAGDECLRKIARALEGQVGRGNDLVARLGGEEFGVLLPGADLEGARRVADAMLNAVWGLAVEHKASPMGRLSVSIGIASWDDARGRNTALLIQQADRALYVSKRSGKNRITVAGAMPVAV